MSKLACHGCVMVLDCTLPHYCGNRVIPKKSIRERVDRWIKSSLFKENSEQAEKNNNVS